MDSYEVIITPDAMAMLTNAVDYIMMEKQNPWAADAVYPDALETADRLQTVAGSLRLCKKKNNTSLAFLPSFVYTKSKKAVRPTVKWQL